MEFNRLVFQVFGRSLSDFPIIFLSACFDPIFSLTLFWDVDPIIFHAGNIKLKPHWGISLECACSVLFHLNITLNWNHTEVSIWNVHVAFCFNWIQWYDVDRRHYLRRQLSKRSRNLVCETSIFFFTNFVHTLILPLS